MRFGVFLVLFCLIIFDEGWLALLVCAGLTGIGVHDLRQTTHTILRNYPVIGHLRFLFEFIRSEIRQYFIEIDFEAAPFLRAQRSLVYQRAKSEPNNQPFGTCLDVGRQDFRIWIGGMPNAPSTSAQPCTQPYRVSVLNILVMSFGSLSANAIQALDKGAQMGDFAHDTGEGSISIHYRLNGGDLIWEIGSGYFGCRNDNSTFDVEHFAVNACTP